MLLFKLEVGVLGLFAGLLRADLLLATEVGAKLKKKPKPCMLNPMSPLSKSLNPGEILGVPTQV